MPFFCRTPERSGYWYGNQTFCTIDYSFHRRFVPLVDFSYHGRFVPWIFRTIRGLFVPFVPWTFRTILGLFVPSLEFLLVSVLFMPFLLVLLFVRHRRVRK